MRETVLFTCPECGELKPEGEKRTVIGGVMRTWEKGDPANHGWSVDVCAVCAEKPKYAPGQGEF